MANVKEYTIHVPDARLKRLQQKLELVDFPEHQIRDAGWKYGTPLSDIKRLTHHWKTSFSWRDQEASMNKLPNYATPIIVDNFGTLGIHFIYQKSGVEGAIPLLFCHGWPDSFMEVTKMLPLLKGGNGRPAFDVVAPILPNYFWSEGVKKKGFEIKQYAETCHKLMQALGYDQYVTRGMALLYPESCKGCHINWIFALPPVWTAENPEPEYNDREKAVLVRSADWSVGDGRGYVAIQSTKPATMAFAHADSPTALLSWIYEKLKSWSDDYPWTDDEILTWVSLYYFSIAGPEACIYHYYEALHGKVISLPAVQGYIDVPLGIADFPIEIYSAPKAWWKTLGPVVFSKTYEEGGHFAGWE